MIINRLRKEKRKKCFCKPFMQKQKAKPSAEEVDKQRISLAKYRNICRNIWLKALQRSGKVSGKNLIKD